MSTRPTPEHAAGAGAGSVTTIDRPPPPASPGHGGARPGAGRKPRAVRQLRDQITPGSPSAEPNPPPGRYPALAPRSGAGPTPEPVAGTIPADDPDHRQAAHYALALFVRTMHDPAQDLGLRLDCAREVLNRTIGKPRVSAEPHAGGPGQIDLGAVHVYMPHNGRSGQASSS